MVGLLALAMLGFVSVTLPSPLSLMEMDEQTWSPVRYFWMEYGFQIPAALFLGALLGPVTGGLAVLAYNLTIARVARRQRARGILARISRKK